MCDLRMLTCDIPGREAHLSSSLASPPPLVCARAFDGQNLSEKGVGANSKTLSMLQTIVCAPHQGGGHYYGGAWHYSKAILQVRGGAAGAARTHLFAVGEGVAATEGANFNQTLARMRYGPSDAAMTAAPVLQRHMGHGD